MNDAVPSEPSLTWPLRLLRRVLPVVMVGFLLVGIGGAARLALYLGEPFPGFALIPRKEIKLLSVIWTTPPQWPGMKAGMRVNDRILCVDGYHPSPDSQVYGLDPRYADVQCPNGGQPYADLFRALCANPERSADFYVDRDGEFLTVPDVPIVRFTPWMLLELFLPLFLFGLGLLTVGAVVYRANRNGEMNLVFALFTTIAAGFAMDWTYVPRISDQYADATAITLIVNVPWISLLGPALFHLTSLLTEPGPLRALAQRARLPYYALSLLSSGIGVFVYVVKEHPLSYRLTPIFYLFIMVSSVFSFGWSILSLGWTFRRTASRRVRHQSAVILLGLVTALGVVVLLVFLFSDVAAPRYIHTAPFFGLAVVAAFAYGILRYQLFAARARILTILLVVILCTLSANLVYLVLGQLTGFLPIFAAALIAGWGLVARRGPTSFLTRLLRREVLDYQTVARFGRRVGGLQQLESLVQAARRSLHDDLEVEHLDVWLLDREQGVLERFCDEDYHGSIPLPQALAGHLVAGPEPSRASAPGGYRDLVDVPVGCHISVWAPLVDRGQAVGLLGLGPRWTGEIYDEQDLQLIGILARQMALSILNARQLERLQATSRLIVQAEENERLKIARELHDTILQFLLVLTYGLDDLKEQQDELAGEIERWQDRISVESGRLRNLLSYLRAPEGMVQKGLIASLQAWIGLMQPGTEVTIETDLMPEAEAVLSIEAQVAIYRVFREAIQNAWKHARGSQVRARLWKESGQICFSVGDDGQGFPVEEALQGEGKGYSSLQDMKAYVESVGGTLEIRSVLGAGTRILGSVPATEEKMPDISHGEMRS